MSNTLELFGLRLFSKTQEDFQNLLKEHFNQKPKKLWLVATPNPEQAVLAWNNPNFFKQLLEFDWLLPDGIGLLWASRWLKWRGKLTHAIKTRITGVDLTAWLLGFAKKHDLAVLLIGGKNYDQLKIGTKKLKIGEIETYRLSLFPNHTNHPTIFWTLGYKNANKPSEVEEANLVSLISQLKPDIILVAFGAPTQESWLVSHRQLLQQIGCRMGLTVGGAMDMLLGQVKRAPSWLQKLSLEWLWRLLVQPWRWRRQLKLIKFVQLLSFDHPH